MTKPRLLYISILGTPDLHDPALYADLADGGDDREWVANRLAEWGVAEAVDYRSTCLTLGGELPDVADVDGVIVGGSLHSVNEGQDWQNKLVAWLSDWRETGGPALGICGGHQTMCMMSGVVVEPRADGPVGGSAAIKLTAEGRAHHLFDGFDDEPWFHFGNYDHAIEVPKGACALAFSDDSPALALDHGGGWLSVQFHPEISHDVIARSWIHIAPENMKNYPALPEGPRILVNFLNGAGFLET